MEILICLLGKKSFFSNESVLKKKSGLTTKKVVVLARSHQNPKPSLLPLPASTPLWLFVSLMASSSRLYNQLSISCHLLNRRSRTNLVNKKISFLSSPLSPSPCSSLHFFKHFSSSVSFEVTTDDTDVAVLPPPPPPATPTFAAADAWPEWDQFVDKMRTKGYFAKTQQDAAASDATKPASPPPSYSSAAVDQNRVKNACLAFGRARYDILRYRLFT